MPLLTQHLVKRVLSSNAVYRVATCGCFVWLLLVGFYISSTTCRADVRYIDPSDYAALQQQQPDYGALYEALFGSAPQSQRVPVTVAVSMANRRTEGMVIYRTVARRFYFDKNGLLKYLSPRLNTYGRKKITDLVAEEGLVSRLSCEMIGLFFSLDLATLSLHISLPASFMNEVHLNLSPTFRPLGQSILPHTPSFYGYINTNTTIKKGLNSTLNSLETVAEPVLVYKSLRYQSSIALQAGITSDHTLSKQRLSYRKYNGLQQVSLGYIPNSLFNRFTFSSIRNRALWGLQYSSNLTWSEQLPDPKPMHPIRVTINQESTLKIVINDTTRISRRMDKGVFILEQMPYLNGLNRVRILQDDVPLYSESILYNRYTLGKHQQYLDYAIGVPYSTLLFSQKTLRHTPMQALISYRYGVSDLQELSALLELTATHHTLYGEYTLPSSVADIRPVVGIRADDTCYIANLGLKLTPFTSDTQFTISAIYDEDRREQTHRIMNRFSLYQYLTPTVRLFSHYGFDRNVITHRNDIVLEHTVLIDPPESPSRIEIGYELRKKNTTKSYLSAYWRYRYQQNRTSAYLSARLYSPSNGAPGTLDPSFSFTIQHVFFHSFDTKQYEFTASNFFVQRPIKRPQGYGYLSIESTQKPNKNRDITLDYRVSNGRFMQQNSLTMTSDSTHAYFKAQHRSLSGNGYLSGYTTFKKPFESGDNQLSYALNMRSSIVFSKSAFGIGEPITKGFVFIKKKKNLKGVTIGFKEGLKESIVGTYVYPIHTIQNRTIILKPNSVSSVGMESAVLTTQFGLHNQPYQGYFATLGSDNTLVISAKLTFTESAPSRARIGTLFPTNNPADTKQVLITKDGRFVVPNVGFGAYTLAIPTYAPQHFIISPESPTLTGTMFYLELDITPATP